MSDPERIIRHLGNGREVTYVRADIIEALDKAENERLRDALRALWTGDLPDGDQCPPLVSVQLHIERSLDETADEIQEWDDRRKAKYRAWAAEYWAAHPDASAERQYMSGGLPSNDPCLCGRAPNPGTKPDGGCWCVVDVATSKAPGDSRDV